NWSACCSWRRSSVLGRSAPRRRPTGNPPRRRCSSRCSRIRKSRSSSPPTCGPARRDWPPGSGPSGSGRPSASCEDGTGRAHSPADLKPGVLHAGLEYHQPHSLLRLGRFATGRLVAGLDAKAMQEHKWQVGWSLVTGLELGDPVVALGSGRRCSVLLKAYTGPAPYGEFYRDYVSSVGVGIGFTLYPDSVVRGGEQRVEQRGAAVA